MQASQRRFFSRFSTFADTGGSSSEPLSIQILRHNCSHPDAVADSIHVATVFSAHPEHVTLTISSWALETKHLSLSRRVEESKLTSRNGLC